MGLEKDCSIEGNIRLLFHVDSNGGIETRIHMKNLSSNQYPSLLVYSGPTGLRSGDYIIADIEGSVSNDDNIGFAKRIVRIKNKKNRKILEQYEKDD